MVQPVPQEQVKPLMACGLPLKVSVIWRFSTEPPPVFFTVPDIVYVTVLFDTSGTGFPHAFVALIAQHEPRCPSCRSCAGGSFHVLLHVWDSTGKGWRVSRRALRSIRWRVREGTRYRGRWVWMEQFTRRALRRWQRLQEITCPKKRAGPLRPALEIEQQPLWSLGVAR